MINEKIISQKNLVKPPFRPVTLVYCIDTNSDSVLLALKKRGFGEGRLNGYGGKVNFADGSIEDCAVRELREESGITTDAGNLEKVAVIDFYFPDIPLERDFNQTVHVYLLRKWIGTPKETEEMKPEWHRIRNVPYNKMWVDDIYWLPRVLAGEKITAEFYFSGQGKGLWNYEVKTATSEDLIKS